MALSLMLGFAVAIGPRPFLHRWTPHGSLKSVLSQPKLHTLWPLHIISAPRLPYRHVNYTAKCGFMRGHVMECSRTDLQVYSLWATRAFHDGPFGASYFGANRRIARWQSSPLGHGPD